MRLGLLALAVVICFGCCAALAAEEAQPAASAASWEVVGTVVVVDEGQQAGQDQPVRFSLRVDEAVEQPGLSLKTGGPPIRFACARAIWRGVGLGDQVRVLFSTGVLDVVPAAGPLWVVDTLTRLGRGEFLNPAAKASIDLGSPDAKVLVKMFAPLGIACHQTTVDLLKQLAGEEPQRLRVQIFDMHAPAMVEEVNRERLSCATVLVNNRYQFTIREGDKERKVEMTHRPNAERSTYNSEDVPVVVRQEMARIYGPANTGEAAAPAG